MQTKITLYNNYESRFNGLPESLTELIQRLAEMLETVPSELHDEVVFEVGTEYESPSVDVDIYYYREETAEEEAKRLNAQAIVLQAEETRHRFQYEKLKARFDP